MIDFTRRRGDAENLIRAETAENSDLRRSRLSWRAFGLASGPTNESCLRRKTLSAVSARIRFFLRASASPRDPIYPQSIT